MGQLVAGAGAAVAVEVVGMLASPVVVAGSNPGRAAVGSNPEQVVVDIPTVADIPAVADIHQLVQVAAKWNETQPLIHRPIHTQTDRDTHKHTHT